MYDPNYGNLKMSIDEVKAELREVRVSFDELGENHLRIWYPNGTGYYAHLEVTLEGYVYVSGSPVDFKKWLYHLVTSRWCGC